MTREIKASACYCRIPLDRLLWLVQKRFVEKIPTADLMKQMKSGREREQLASVALLDVSEQDVIHMVDAEDPAQLRHLLDCRTHAREMLRKKGIPLKTR